MKSKMKGYFSKFAYRKLILFYRLEKSSCFSHFQQVLCIYMFMCVYVCVHVGVSACVYICNMHIFVHKYIYTYINKQISYFVFQNPKVQIVFALIHSIISNNFLSNYTQQLLTSQLSTKWKLNIYPI